MNRRTIDVLLGMALGDAYLNVRTRLQSGKYPYIFSSMRVLHSTKQQSYCEFKCVLVNALLDRSASVHIIRNGPGGRYQAAHFSVSHPCFKELKEWLYPNGKKTISRAILDRLSPEGIALWYMDDGCARRNYNSRGEVSSVATQLSTCCSNAEAALVCQWFIEKYSIAFKPFRDGRGWSIGTNTQGSLLFSQLVQPYVVQAMPEKLGHVADLNSRQRCSPVGSCAQCGGVIFARRRKGLCDRCYARRYYWGVLRPRRVSAISAPLPRNSPAARDLEPPSAA
jgi:hypothetical protein